MADAHSRGIGIGKRWIPTCNHHLSNIQSTLKYKTKLLQLTKTKIKLKLVVKKCFGYLKETNRSNIMYLRIKNKKVYVKYWPVPRFLLYDSWHRLSDDCELKKCNKINKWMYWWTDGWEISYILVFDNLVKSVGITSTGKHWSIYLLRQGCEWKVFLCSLYICLVCETEMSKYTLVKQNVIS